MTTDALHPAEVKRCCASLYASDWASLLLGESLHPGGPALTSRLGVLLGLAPGHRVLDVASGPGRSAVYLAERFGCAVTGVDLAQENVAAARAAATRSAGAGRVRFLQGDAEALPFADGAFDAVVCECALCTFPDKPAACGELSRVLRPGGRVGLSDLTVSGPQPDDLASLLAWVACVADARPVVGYQGLLEDAGFAVDHVERHDAALRQMVVSIRARLLGAELLVKLRRLEPAGVDLGQARAIARSVERAIDAGTLGYALLVGTKRTSRPHLPDLDSASGAAAQLASRPRPGSAR